MPHGSHTRDDVSGRDLVADGRGCAILPQPSLHWDSTLQKVRNREDSGMTTARIAGTAFELETEQVEGLMEGVE
ncbi:MAG: hypothetical protein ACRD12_17745, partial [Acidimicrobiales bacterium]